MGWISLYYQQGGGLTALVEPAVASLSALDASGGLFGPQAAVTPAVAAVSAVRAFGSTGVALPRAVLGPGVGSGVSESRIGSGLVTDGGVDATGSDGRTDAAGGDGRTSVDDVVDDQC